MRLTGLYGRVLLTSFILFSGVQVSMAGRPDVNHDDSRALDIVLAVDLSGSTNGIINDIRNNLWTLVNQIGQLEPAHDLRIGFVGFSRPSFGKENAYVRILCPLTRDFDLLATELYRLKPMIEKGDQFVSEAIRVSVNNMKWSDREDARKMVFLIGNGMVANNGFDYVKSCELARQKSIAVHCIYVRKNHANWIREIPGWRRIAQMTNGVQTEAMVNAADNIRIWKTADTDPSSLNLRYNDAMLWSGRDSAYRRQCMMTADSGAYHAGRDAFLGRLYYKSSAAYKAGLPQCDLAQASDLVASEPDAYISTDNFQSRICQQYFWRENLRSQIQRSFPGGDLYALQKAYLENQMPDDNILHRCILNIIFASLGLKK